MQLDLFGVASDDDIRAWARDVGFDCPKNGRIPDSIRETHDTWAENPHPVVDHILLPNMAWACGADMLACKCCRTHYGLRPSCPWCRSLGQTWVRWATLVIQGRDPVTREARNTDPERALLAGAS